jgi:hypothetical protein
MPAGFDSEGKALVANFRAMPTGPDPFTALSLEKVILCQYSGPVYVYAFMTEKLYMRPYGVALLLGLALTISAWGSD